MKLTRLSKKTGRPKVLGENGDTDISWAASPGFRDGPEDYFCLKVEADDHSFAPEFSVDESRRIQEQVNKFLQYIDAGKHRWEPGNYFKKMKKNERQPLFLIHSMTPAVFSSLFQLTDLDAKMDRLRAKAAGLRSFFFFNVN